MDPKSFLNFDKFVTPSLVAIIYWLGLICVLVAGLGMIFTAFSVFGGGLKQVLTGILFIVFGALMVRIFCEAIMLSFRIYGRLTEIRDLLNRR